MKLSLLHISDLHRDPQNPIRNDVLLDSLENDKQRYSFEEDPKIKSPDIIIVSGDIIQGIKHDSVEPENNLREQYREALDFLIGLADRFVNGNRDHVILVPGNHDVSSYHFLNSLRRIDIPADRKRELASQLFIPGSRLRWSWQTFELFEVIDPALYLRRLEAYSEFYSAFYQGKRRFDLDPSKQIDVFDFPNFGLAIAGFSSCYNNDLFNRRASIHPACIATAGTILRSPAYQGRIRMGVWHHNSEGVPETSDYMDPDLVQNLLDRGFSFGFHGHQHRPQYIDTRFRHGSGRKINVISAGTLCGGASFRHGRSYNIVEIDTDIRNGRLHIREMQNNNLMLPIWGPRPLAPTTKPYYEFQFEAPEPLQAMGSRTTALVEAQKLFDLNEYKKSADILVKLLNIEPIARPLLLGCLLKLKDLQSMIAFFNPPTNEAEIIHLMDALWLTGNKDELKKLIASPVVENSTDPSVIEMKRKFEARLGR